MQADCVYTVNQFLTDPTCGIYKKSYEPTLNSKVIEYKVYNH